MKHNLTIFFISPLFLLAATLLSMSSTCAQSRLVSDNTAPKSAEFVAPILSYSSVFGQYQRYQEEEATSWPEANATVGRIGGWRYYLEEASQPDQSDQQSVTPLQPPTSPLLEESGRHAGHEGKP
jgi:hypothetical protein